MQCPDIQLTHFVWQVISVVTITGPPGLQALPETPISGLATNGPAALSTLELVAVIVGNLDTALNFLAEYSTLAEIAQAAPQVLVGA